MAREFLDGKIIIKTGDITKEHVDIIVNAANSSLMGGGGVDGAIHRAGGNSILEECKKIRESEYKDGLPTGQSVATTAGNLPAHRVVHTVGPVWNGGGRDEEKLLADCYAHSLNLAFQLGASTISFPAISTGVYRFPKEKAASIAFDTVTKAIEDKDDITVSFVFFSEGDMNIFLENIN